MTTKADHNRIPDRSLDSLNPDQNKCFGNHGIKSIVCDKHRRLADVARFILPFLAFFVVGVLSCGDAWCDLDRDGEVDVVFAHARRASQVCLGDGTGGFLSCEAVSIDRDRSRGVALADMNKDGNLDVVFSNQESPNRLCPGDGKGGFLACSDVNTESRFSIDVAMADLNRDGNVDAVFANTSTSGDQNQVCLGDGEGSFKACSNISEDRRVTHDVALVEVNGDGNLDAIFANFTQTNRVCLGDGNGGFFSCNDVSSDKNSTWGVALDDLDNDDDLDVVFTNENQPNRVCLGDGKGNFSNCADMSTDTNKTMAVALADFNRDGFTDAVLANGGGFTEKGQKNRICLGDGVGGFHSCSDISGETDISWDVGIEDMDDDGFLDIIFAEVTHTNHVCLGDGNGGFTACNEVAGNTAQLGKADLAIATSFQINAGHAGAWFNPETPGQGQLVDVEPEGKFLFASWFTFTDAGSDHSNEQHWFTAQGNYAGDSADLVVYETLGGAFDDPQAVSTEAVGNATLSFADCGKGQLDYTIDSWGLEGSFPLQRAIPGTENVCQERAGLSTEPLEPNDGRDGAWYDPASPGQGFLIDAHPDDEFIFVAWFTYGEDAASGQRWLTAQGPLQGFTADLVVYETLGGSFDEPDPSETDAVGTMTIDFTDCRNAQLTYAITDEALAGMIDIERAIPGTEELCKELTQ